MAGCGLLRARELFAQFVPVVVELEVGWDGASVSQSVSESVGARPARESLNVAPAGGLSHRLEIEALMADSSQRAEARGGRGGAEFKCTLVYNWVKPTKGGHEAAGIAG